LLRARPFFGFEFLRKVEHHHGLRAGGLIGRVAHHQEPLSVLLSHPARRPGHRAPGHIDTWLGIWLTSESAFVTGAVG